MDEQTDRSFQLRKAQARQRALKESIHQELEIYRQQAIEDAENETVEKEDLRKKIIDSRVMIEDARQRIAYNLQRLGDDFEINWNIKDVIVENPRRSLLLAAAAGFYFGLKK